MNMNTLQHEQVCAYLGLGSNMDHPEQQIKTAFIALQQQPGITLCKTSSLYRTAPVSDIEQPDFINAAVAITTTLSPHQLLKTVLALEQQHGRVRTVRWGPRTLDIDILLYGQQNINDSELTIPHPYLCERAFVLYPLAEIAPDLQLPDGRTLRNLLAQHTLLNTDLGIEKLSLAPETIERG